METGRRPNSGPAKENLNCGLSWRRLAAVAALTWTTRGNILAGHGARRNRTRRSKAPEQSKPVPLCSDPTGRGLL